MTAPTDTLTPLERLMIYAAVDWILSGRQDSSDFTVFEAMDGVMEAVGLNVTDFNYEAVFAAVERETNALPGRVDKSKWEDCPWESGKLGRSLEHARVVDDHTEETLLQHAILGQE